MGAGLAIVAMSGGVDSSVAVGLLQKAGYEVIGVTMRLWADSAADYIYQAVGDAKQVCQILGIPHYYLNLERQFQTYVIDYFCQEYSRGRTPNPCIVCNQKIKFDFFLNRALAMGAQYLATGHYARIQYQDHQYRLLKAVDQAKDQSYFLYTLDQTKLKHLLVPLGEYHKDEVCRIAHEMGLPVTNRPESQEICFIPDGDYREFVAQHTSPTPGEIIDTNGRMLGKHKGTAFYTVGQRRGLDLTSGERLYILRIDPQNNTLIVGSEDKLLCDTLFVDRVHFVSGESPRGPTPVTAKIRYRSSEAKATLILQGQRAEVRFEQPQRAITPGQSVVFYQNEDVLGGGVIESSPLDKITPSHI